MKNKDWGRGRGGGGLINFPPLKRGGLFERGGLIEDLRYIMHSVVNECVSAETLALLDNKTYKRRVGLLKT